jgi:hypothetical protein
VHIPEVEFTLDPVNPIAVSMEPVEAQLILHPKPNHQAHGQTDGQAGQVYQGIHFVPKKISHRDFEVILQHIALPEILKFTIYYEINGSIVHRENYALPS